MFEFNQIDNFNTFVNTKMFTEDNLCRISNIVKANKSWD